LKRNVKKRIVRLSVVVTIWIILPAFCTLMTSIATDIVNGVCAPYVVFSSYMQTPIVVVTFLLPLALMIFCYARIVYSLRKKVTATHNTTQS